MLPIKKAREAVDVVARLLRRLRGWRVLRVGHFGDHKGVIRNKWIGYPGTKPIDVALEKLIEEAERNGKQAPK